MSVFDIGFRGFKGFKMIKGIIFRVCLENGFKGVSGGLWLYLCGQDDIV